MTSPHDLALLRLAAQRICCPDLEDAYDVVHWLTAVQGQDRPGAVAAIALRTTKPDRVSVEAYFDAGRIVRSWPMRGTLHVVAAADLGWLLQLTAPRMLVATAARRQQLGLDGPTLTKAEALVVGALSGGRQLSRAELLAVFEAGGLSVDGGRGYHVQFHLSQLGVLCFGPVRDGEQLAVLVDEWILEPRRLDREEALTELALRYFRSHGPATPKDFSRWTNLVAVDVKAAIAAARPDLERIEVDGREYLMDPLTPSRLSSCIALARGVFLLPGFDEYMLGYRDRSAMLAPAFADRIVPGANGMFKATVVSDGQVVGTWAHAGRGAKRTLIATPFVSFTKKVEAAAAKAYLALP